MLYTVASWNWAPGNPLTPAMARGGLSRWRPKTEASAAGGPTLAVALRYDGTRGQVVAEGTTARGNSGPWSAPAIVDSTGGVMVLAAIPAALVRVIGEAEIRVHEATKLAVPRAHRSVGPSTPAGRVRVVNGRALFQQQESRFSFGKATARSTSSRMALETPCPTRIARTVPEAPVRQDSGTTSAPRSEADALRDSRPPPGSARGGLPLKWKKDDGS